MIKFFTLLLVCVFLSCKREIPKFIAVSKPVIALSNDGTIAIDTAQINKFHSGLLTSFYRSHNNKTVWVLSNQRKILLLALNNSDQEGLNPNDYNVRELEQYEGKTAFLSEQNWAVYDLLLTNSLQNYVLHLTNGKLNPRTLYKDWDLKENKIDINETITKLQQSDSLACQIEQLKPNYIVYKRLKNALKIISAFPNDSFKKNRIH